MSIIRILNYVKMYNLPLHDLYADNHLVREEIELELSLQLISGVSQAFPLYCNI